MADKPLSPGKFSSEFIITLGLVVAYVVLVLNGSLSATGIDDLIQLGMVYIGGRSLPKVAEQIKVLGRNKHIDDMLAQALEKEKK